MCFYSPPPTKNGLFIMPYYKRNEKYTNDDFSVAQHYIISNSERSAKITEGGAVKSFGTCFGLSLSWLKSIATHGRGRMESFPLLRNKHGVSEGLLLQHLYSFGHYPSSYYEELLENGGLDIEKQASAAVESQLLAKTEKPDSEHVKQSIIGEGLAIYGWSVVRDYMLTPFGVLTELHNIDWDNSSHLYIVTTSNHAGAIAICDSVLSFYDPNQGLVTYSKDEAISNVRLMADLNHFTRGYESSVISLTEVKY
uniref:YopT-type cysteine protease domain-containing protein n=1 Tax=Aeromonas sp. TaxID=647 RepID=UPI001930F9A1|nr:YopT-type cysteine protease domain-containing protein [Aeromonas sp.]QHJ90294.1 Hypothetical protein [Aeromonas sp.]